MGKIHYNLFFSISLLGIISCEENIPSINNPTGDFTIISTLNIEDGFVKITASDGAVLHEVVGGDLSGVFVLRKEVGERVDVTYGYEFDNLFRINTYRDVASGFELKNSFFSCSEQTFITQSRDFDLEIKGIHQYDHLYFPFLNKTEVVSDATDNTLSLSGRIKSEESLYLTIAVSNKYKSIMLDFEDWEKIGSDDAFLSLHISDFETPELHSIQMEKEENWIVNAALNTGSLSNTIISRWTKYSDNQSGDHIKLFTPQGMDFISLNLDVKNNNFINGQKITNTYSDFPASISMFDPVIINNNILINSYNVGLTADYDLLEFRYYYVNENFASVWYLFNLPESTMNYQLPEIPQDYLENSSIMKFIIDQPKNWIATAYKEIGNHKIKELYEQTNIDNELPCINYESKFKGDGF